MRRSTIRQNSGVIQHVNTALTEEEIISIVNIENACHPCDAAKIIVDYEENLKELYKTAEEYKEKSEVELNKIKDELKKVYLELTKVKEPVNIIEYDNKNTIDYEFEDEKAVRILTVEHDNSIEGAFTAKFYLNIYVYDHEKNNSCSRYIECVFSGTKKRGENFLASSEVLFSTSSLKTHFNLDLGIINTQILYEDFNPSLYLLIDIIPGKLNNKLGKIKGHYSLIYHNEEGLIKIY